MIKSIIKLLKKIKCKIFVCCGSKCSINNNDEINISAISKDETVENRTIEG
jgi:hypothetical protein